MYLLVGIIGMLASLYIMFHSWARVPDDNAAVFLVFMGLMLFVTNAGFALEGLQRRK